MMLSQADTMLFMHFYDNDISFYACQIPLIFALITMNLQILHITEYTMHLFLLTQLPKETGAYLRQNLWNNSEAKFQSPWLGDKVDSGIG